MKTITNQNHDILKNEYKNYFLNSLNQLKNKDKIIIGLSGGSSLTIFYDDFSNIFSEIEDEIREKIYFGFLDERVVDFTSDESNYKQIKNQFLDKLVDKGFIKNSQILLPDFSIKNYDTDYFEKIQKIDIGLFGVGPDGHTCSLFPNHKLLSDKTFGYLKISDSPKPPSERITISVNMLTDTTFAFVFFMGENKREAKDNFYNENVNTLDCPVKLVKNCVNTVVFSDIE